MSTGADCYFTEREPGKWFYKLQQWPYGDWEEYETYGPFPLIATAIDHLSSNHANPGGWSEHVHADHIHNGAIDEYDGQKLWTCCNQSVS